MNEDNQYSLSSQISTDVTIALPEMVAIFISKYETQLYDKKADLTADLKAARKALEAHRKSVCASMSFKEFDNLSIPKLGVKSKIIEKSKEITWEASKSSVSISVSVFVDDKAHPYHAKEFSIRKTKPIPKIDVTKHSTLLANVEATKTELENVLSLITNMSRKERQVKARISELRLKEQGLSDFINSAEMQALIKLD